MNPKNAARSILRNFVDRAPQTRYVQRVLTKPNDQEICLVSANETDDGINFVTFREISREFDAFAQRGFTGFCVQPFIALSTIFD